MAATINTSTVIQGQLGEGVWIVAGTAALDASYATNGEVLDLSSYVGVDAKTTVLIGQVEGVNGVYEYRHDGGNASAGKVVAYLSDNGAQVAATTNMTGFNFKFIAIGVAP